MKEIARPRVYIETSIPSFYYEIRPEAEMVARKDWTREWWDQRRNAFETVTSIPVIEELDTGDHPCKTECLQLISDIPLLSIPDPITDIVATYIDHHVMPQDPTGDALHLALASYHRCRFLLTWNCTHLANANKQEHIRHVNALLGLPTPVLTTPLELLKPEANEVEQ